MKTFFAFVALFFTGAVAAASPSSGPREALLSWTRPLHYTDGTLIPSSVIITYFVYRGTSEQTCSTTKLSGAFTSALTLLLTNQPLGKQCYCLTAHADGVESAPNGPGCKTMRLPAPTEGAIEAPTDGSIER